MRQVTQVSYIFFTQTINSMILHFLRFLCHTYQLYLEPAKKVVKS